jgi:hypothetical protein
MSPATRSPAWRRPARTSTHQPNPSPLRYQRRERRHPSTADSERGSLVLYLLPVTLVLLLFAGLVFDGGTALAARGRAADLAAQAARAGADALTPASLRAGGPVDLRIDPVTAQAAGQRVLAAAGARGTITVHDNDVVTVTATVPARTAILSAIGIDDASGTATASATPVHAVASQGGQ